MAYEIKTPHVGVAVIARNKEGEIVVIKRGHKLAAEYGTWSIPGGWIDYGEHFIDAAKRELFEETGLTLENPEVFGITNDKMKVYHSVTIMIIGKVMNTKVKIQKAEVSEYKWCKTNKIPRPHFTPLKNLIKTKE